MTVSSQTSTATFVGNGVATAFPLPFRFFENGDIRAYFIDSVTGAATQMVLGTDYTLIGAGEPEVDGNALSLLTTTAPLASMRGLYVERFMPQTQSTDLVNQGEFFASTHEDVFDRLTMLIQQQVTETNKAKAEADEALAIAQEMVARQEAFENNYTYVILGPYGAGLVFTSYNQTFSYLGEFYAPSAGVVLPYTTTGVGAAEIATFRSVGDAVLRADLENPAEGSSIVGYLPSGTGAVGSTAQAKMRESVSVKDFGAVGDGITNDTAAIQAAVDASRSVYFPSGVYLISSPIRLSEPRQVLRGAGKGSVSLLAAVGFSEATIGGSTGAPMIWYQPAGQWDVLAGMVQGGEISGITLHASNHAAEGVRLNRVVLEHVLRDIEILGAGIGVLGTGFGWGTHFDGCYIHDCPFSAINLQGAYHGISLENCGLYGGDLTTQVLLSIDGSNTSSLAGVYGNFGISITGGYIEGGLVGARLKFSSAVFSGVDFEGCYQNFIQTTGNFSGTYPSWLLLNACPPVVVQGCNFVGAPTISSSVPYVGGLVCVGGTMVVTGSYFWNQDAVPGAGIYAMNGVQGGDIISGFIPPCIAEMQNDFVGWNNQNFTGTVQARMSSVNAGPTSVTKLQVGAATSQNTYTNIPANIVGYAQIPKVFGYAAPGYGTDALVAAHYAYGDSVNSGSIDSYIGSNPSMWSGALQMFANNQGGVPNMTYGKAGLYAQITSGATSFGTLGVRVDTILAGVVPFADNTHVLGSAPLRWKQLFAGTATISTSDENEKQQIQPIDAAALRAWGRVDFCQYKFNDAVESKGADARWHFGVIAQRVKAAFESEGLDAFAYGVLCYDEWEEEAEVVGEGGVALQPYRPAGQRYGIRYEEALALECAYLRSRLSR